MDKIMDKIIDFLTNKRVVIVLTVLLCFLAIESTAYGIYANLHHVCPACEARESQRRAEEAVLYDKNSSVPVLARFEGLHVSSDRVLDVLIYAGADLRNGVTVKTRTNPEGRTFMNYGDYLEANEQVTEGIPFSAIFVGEVEKDADGNVVGLTFTQTDTQTE